MHVARLDCVGELEHVPGSLDVRKALRLGIRRHVVDGSQVEEVVDVAAKLLGLLVCDSKARLPEIADDRNDAIGAGPPAASQLLEPPLRALPHEDVDRSFAGEQAVDEVPADEPGRPGDEVAHALSSTNSTLHSR